MGLHEVKDKPIPRCKPAISQVVDLVIALLFLFPEGEVLLEELNDALGIAEVVLLELVDLVESLLESAISELASLGVILQDFVVEDGEVQGEAELDWVAWGKIDSVSLLVGYLGGLLDLLKLGVLGVLSDVTIVVTDHLDEESLGLIGALTAEDAGVDHVNDLLAVSHELGLDLGLVGEKGGIELGVLGVLLDSGNSAASSAFAGDEVLESDGEEVTLIGVDTASLGCEDFVEEINHVFEALSLLSNSGEENLLFNLVCHLVMGG